MDSKSIHPRILFLICLIPLLGWWLYGLFDLDEGFYAAVVGEMNRRGEWITPYVNGKPWFEKPILLYWVAKPLVMVFGQALGARMPSILATAGCYALVFWFARHHLDKLAIRPVRSGYAAMLVLATSLLFVAVGRLMMTDTLLTFCLVGALFAFWHGLTRDPRAWLWAGIALGGSVLAKGPVGIILFTPIAIYALRLHRGPRPWLWGIAGFVAMLVVTASWYLPAYLKDGDLFVQKFLVEQNLQRFQGGDQAHTVGGITRFVFFIPILLLGMAPWSWWIKKSWPKRADDAALKFLAACAAIPFLFFTISSAKLPHYILPCLPPLALLIGHYLAGIWPKIPRWTFAWLGALTILANVGFMTWYRLSGHEEVHALARYVKDQPGAVAVYQMPRREKSLGTGKPKIQETSHPSLAFVLDKTYVDAETLEDLLDAPRPLWILTRANRISDEDKRTLESRGAKLEEFRPVAVDNYRLYELH